MGKGFDAIIISAAPSQSLLLSASKYAGISVPAGQPLEHGDLQGLIPPTIEW